MNRMQPILHKNASLVDDVVVVFATSIAKPRCYKPYGWTVCCNPLTRGCYKRATQITPSTVSVTDHQIGLFDHESVVCTT